MPESRVIVDSRIASPASAFESPDALASSDLSARDKRTALSNWAQELRQLLAAEEENMGGEGSGHLSDTLSKVESLLAELGGGSDSNAKL